MELVTIPLSQRTRSSPVTRIHPTSARGERPAPWSRAASWEEGLAGCRVVVSEWVAGIIAEWRTERKTLRTLDYSDGLSDSCYDVLFPNNLYQLRSRLYRHTS